MSQIEVETQQHALNILVQAVQAAQKRGVFSLDEAAVISQAVDVFMPPAPPEEEPTQGDFSSESEGEETSEEESA